MLLFDLFNATFISICYHLYNLIGLLTKKFISLLQQAEDGTLDLNKAADMLEVCSIKAVDHLVLLFSVHALLRCCC